MFLKEIFFSYIFYECKLLSDIKGLENWFISKINIFSYIFSGSKSLSDIKNLNVSKINNFSYLFSGCKSLMNLKVVLHLYYSLNYFPKLQNLVLI